MRLDEYQKALSLQEEALQIDQKFLPPNHPNLPMKYGNIGNIYAQIREYSKVLASYEKHLQFNNNPNHLDSAMFYNNIATVYANMGNYSRARSSYGRTADIVQQSLTLNHPNQRLHRLFESMTQQNIGQRFVCVWLDNQVDQSRNSNKAQDILRTVVNSFRSFNDLNKCVDFIINMRNAKIIFVTLDVLAEDILPIVHFSEQIHSIYIFISNTSIGKQWTKDYAKIKGIFNNINGICEKIKENLTRSENDHVGISFISSADIKSRDVNRQDPSFMYSQLLKEIILNDHLAESEEETKNEMLVFCRNIYTDNQETLNILGEFEKDFLPELSVYWYTRECFLYKMLNKALWTPQPDVLYKLRYFLRHLHQQILSQAKLQHYDQSSMIVYRGQNMSMEEIEKLKQNVGGFLSFNNFLSTTFQRNVGLSFLNGPKTGVLFEIFIDTTIKKFPFANIEHLSFQQGHYGERELLFSMGTVFRIVGMDTGKQFHRVQLMLTADMDQQLAEYTKRTREEIRSSHCFLSLLKLMYELRHYNSLDRFAKMFDDDDSLTDDPELLDVIHNTFGLIYHNRGQLKDALKHFHESLNICLLLLPADHPKLAVTYNNIGCVYSSQSNYETALTFHQLALDCQSNSETPNISSIITYTNNIASIYNQQENYNEALVYHKRALELQKEHLGDNDPSLTNTYNAISTISYKLDDYGQAATYHEKAVALHEDTSQMDPEAAANCSMTAGTFCLQQEQYQEALHHFNRALQIQQQYFLPNNPALSITYDRIAAVYYKQDQFAEALSYHLKALEVEQNSLSNDHPSIATSYFRISKDYTGLSFWSDALEYGFKAIEQLKKSSHTDVDTLTSFIDHIGQIYYQKDEYEQALTYYKEALDISLTHLPDDDASLIGLYYRTANAYYKLERYNEALSFYQKTLNIELKTLPDNAKTIAVTHAHISSVYFHLKQFDDALNAANQGLNQLLKTLPYNHHEVVQQRACLDAIKIKQLIEDGYD